MDMLVFLEYLGLVSGQMRMGGVIMYERTNFKLGPTPLWNLDKLWLS
jgi:hypothetical protein